MMFIGGFHGVSRPGTRETLRLVWLTPFGETSGFERSNRRIMMRNVGRAERWARIVGGVVLMFLGLTLPVPFWVVEVAETVGMLAAVTGAIGYCPVRHAPALHLGRGRL